MPYASKLRAGWQFFSFQGITLAGNLLYGLLCVRLLPPSDYSKFVVVFGVQGTVAALMDANLSISLVPLIGDRVNDRQFIADYVASLRHLSRRLYAVVAAGLICVYPLLVRNRRWGWPTVTLMVATLLLTTWSLRVSATYGTVLIVLRDRVKWYQGQQISSLGTLALLGIAWSLHLLSAFTAIAFNVLGVVFVGAFYFWRARQQLGVAGVISRAKEKAIVRLALPNVPQAVFYALQGQLALMLITIFGRTNGIASVGALARLGAMFTLIGQLNPLLIEPYFAKLPESRFRRSYVATLALAIAGLGAFTLVAGLLPGVFLWVLGPKYAGLRFEVLLAIAASSIATLSGALWTIHSARRYVYWWANNLNMVLIFLTQLAFILKADLSLVRTAIWMNLATNAASLLVNILAGVYGLYRGPRTIAPPNETELTLELESALQNERTEPAHPILPSQAE